MWVKSPTKLGLRTKWFFRWNLLILFSICLYKIHFTVEGQKHVQTYIHAHKHNSSLKIIWQANEPWWQVMNSVISIWCNRFSNYTFWRKPYIKKKCLQIIKFLQKKLKFWKKHFQLVSLVFCCLAIQTIHWN